MEPQHGFAPKVGDSPKRAHGFAQRQKKSTRSPKLAQCARRWRGSLTGLERMARIRPTGSAQIRNRLGRMPNRHDSSGTDSPNKSGTIRPRAARFAQRRPQGWRESRSRWRCRPQGSRKSTPGRCYPSTRVGTGRWPVANARLFCRRLGRQTTLFRARLSLQLWTRT